MTIKHLFLSAALLLGAASTASTASAGPDEYLGEILLVGYNFCPRGTSHADGKLLPISSYSALFSLYGTMYGGDGRTTFALPAMRGRTIVGDGRGPGLSPRVVGRRGGTETHTSRGEVKTAKGDDVAAAKPNSEVNNMQPYQVLRYCVVTQGVFPSRS